MLNLNLISGRSLIIQYGAEYSCELKGTDEEKNSIETKKINSNFHITQKRTLSSNNGFNFNGNIIIANGLILEEKKSTLDIIITIPKEDKITACFEGYFASVIFPNIKMADITLSGATSIKFQSVETLNAKILGSGHIITNSVKILSLQLAGSGFFQAEYMEGTLHQGCVTGSGKIIVKNANIDYADISLKGSGYITILGKVNTLNVSLMGSGGIYVEEVTGKIHKDKAGSGELTINEKNNY